MPKIKKDDMKSIHSSMRDLRVERREFLEVTLSFRDLKQHGLSEKEIERIPSVTRCGEKRYEKHRVWEFLTYQQQIKDKSDSSKQIDVHKCLCDNPDCAKCLGVNCNDNNCSVHVLSRKMQRRHPALFH